MTIRTAISTYRKITDSTDKTWSITVCSSDETTPDNVHEIQWRTSWGKTGQNQTTSRWHYAGWHTEGTAIPEVMKLIESKVKSGYVIQPASNALKNVIKEDNSYLDIL